MATAVFVVDQDGFNRAFRSWGGIVGKHIGKTMSKAIILSKASAPSPGRRPRNRTMINYSTGFLAASIIGKQSMADRDVEAHIIALAPHALMVHNGTRPHTIRPVRATALRFFWVRMGQNVVLQKVNHPGTRAIPFLSENLRAAIR